MDGAPQPVDPSVESRGQGCGGHARAARRAVADQPEWPCTRCGRKIGAASRPDRSPRDRHRPAGRPGVGPAPDRVPARASAGRQLPDQGLPRRGGHAADRRRRRGAGAGRGRARCASCPGSARRPRASSRSAWPARRPAYLTELEGTAGPLVEGGEEYRAALRGDLHTHSDWSDGGSPIEEMAMTAMELGHDVPRPHRPLAAADAWPTGCRSSGSPASSRSSRPSTTTSRPRETSGCSPASRSTSSRTAASTRPTRCSTGSTCVVASVHSKLRMDRAAMTRRMVAAVRHPRTNVLGHCTGRLVMGGRGTRPQSEFDAEAVFAACAEHDVAVEINSRPERSDPPDDLVGLALEAGCLFSIDSDAHAPGPAGLPGLRRGAGAAARRAARPDRQHLARRPAAGAGPTGNLPHMAAPRHERRRRARRRGAALPQAAPDGRGLPRGRQGRGAGPGPVHPGRGAGVGGHDAGPAREVREAPAAQRRRAGTTGGRASTRSTSTVAPSR